VAGGLSAWAALTNPFTTSANTVTAIAIGLAAAAVVVRWRPATLGPVVDAGEPTARRWPWLVLAVALVAWELVSYELGPRIDHPTLSSLYNSAATVRALKGAIFFVWLLLGAVLIRR
jgi:hypothetical protein